jgi:hypothetical protein
MAKEIVVVDGVQYERSKITRNGGDGKQKPIGYGHMPVVPETTKTEDEYALWLNDMVERGVFTWKQIVTQGLYNIFLRMSATIGSDYVDSVAGKKPTKLSLAQQVEMLAFHGRAVEALGPKAKDPALLIETMNTMWWQSKQTAAADWDAGKHSLFPKDVR